MLRLHQWTVLLIFSVLPLKAQAPDAHALLKRALHLADLYNWADAAPEFTKAEEMFTAVGEQRNALYARLGRIRSTLERDQRPLPEASDELATELETNPLLQSDKQLRMFCLIVKGAIDTETNTRAMRDDWQQVQALAVELGDAKWQYRALAQLGLAAFYDGDLETARKNVGTALAGVPDAGHQYLINASRVTALVGLKRMDEAERLAEDVLIQARRARRTVQEATVRLDCSLGLRERAMMIGQP